nr:hypothetical protein BAR15_180088 [Bartonella sp. AR 15-3]
MGKSEVDIQEFRRDVRFTQRFTKSGQDPREAGFVQEGTEGGWLRAGGH